MNNNSFLSSSLKYGLFGGFAIIIISLLLIISFDLGNASGLLIMSIMSLVSAIIIYSLFSYLSIKNQRDNIQDGEISYWHAFFTAFTTCMVIAILGTIFTYIYHNFIDPSYFQTMASIMEEMLEEQGYPEEKMDQIVAGIKESASPKKMLNSVLYGAVFGVIISLITAAILKKDPEQEFTA